MYPAVDEHRLEFRLVHVKDSSPIGYQKYCKKEDKPVPDEEIAKAFEAEGELVLLEDEDFAAVEGESYKTMEILDFVPYEQIDPIYFERTYYLGPDKGAEKVYALLVKAMEQAGLSGIVRYVFHDREQLACLRMREGVLTIERMYYADEIRPLDGIRPERAARVDRRELEMASMLIERTRDDFNPGKYEDLYRERLLDVIETKRRGGSVAPKPKEKRDAAPDLLQALQESVERARGGNGKPANRGRTTGPRRAHRQAAERSRSEAGRGGKVDDD